MESESIRIGEKVDIEWIPGEFWRNGVLVSLEEKKACVRLPSGWHVYPEISCLRKI